MTRRFRNGAWLLGAAMVPCAVSCGPAEPGADAAPGDAPVERREPPPPPGLRCGGATCTANQVCVFPCNTATVRCYTRTDGGACPPDWTAGVCPPDTSPNGCLAPTPPPVAPYCLDMPPACGSTASCACLPFAACMSRGTCDQVSGRVAMCRC